MVYNKFMLTKNEKETIALGKMIGEKLTKGMVLALKGDLAGGKTTFTKGIGLGLNIDDVINSPTFNILKIYHGRYDLYHIDAYRLENNDYDLGLDEYIDDVVTVIEWPDYYANLPLEYLEINFKYLDDETREISFIPHGGKYQKMIEEIL